MNCRNCGGFDKRTRRGLCHACYERERRAGKISPLVSASSARQHINLLVSAGWRYREIARAAEVDRTVVMHIMRGRERINAKTAVVICGIGLGEREQHRKFTWTTRRDPQYLAERARQQAEQAAWQQAAEAARKAAQEARRRAIELARGQTVAVSNPVEQRARQEAIMAERRRAAQRQHELARPHGLVIELPVGWVDEALCSQTDPEMFFPEKGGSTHSAKKICRNCPVQQQCLTWALEHTERFGIWGGLSERERRRMGKTA